MEYLTLIQTTRDHEQVPNQQVDQVTNKKHPYSLFLNEKNEFSYFCNEEEDSFLDMAKMEQFINANILNDEDSQLIDLNSSRTIENFQKANSFHSLSNSGNKTSSGNQMDINANVRDLYKKKKMQQKLALKVASDLLKSKNICLINSQEYKLLISQCFRFLILKSYGSRYMQELIKTANTEILDDMLKQV